MQTRHTSRTNIDKKEAVTEINKQMVTKWNRKYACSEKDSSIQDIFYEVGKRNCYGERDRPTFAALNQLLSGHSILNSHHAKIDKNFSSICDNCQELKMLTILYFIVANIQQRQIDLNGQWKIYYVEKGAMMLLANT